MNKSVVVTGAGQGLGYCIVKRHLDSGDHVFALDYKVSEDLRQLSKDNPNRIRIGKCDISSTKEVEETFANFSDEPKTVDVLYNVAGVYSFKDKVGLRQTDMETFTAMYNINAVGALRVCRALWDAFSNGSVIINISSEAGSIGSCWRKQEYAYCMSKAALNMGAKLLSNELEDRGVRVINIHPGWMRTTMGGEKAFASDRSVSPEESARHIVGIASGIDQIPKDRMYMTHTGDPLVW